MGILYLSLQNDAFFNSTPARSRYVTLCAANSHPPYFFQY